MLIMKKNKLALSLFVFGMFQLLGVGVRGEEVSLPSIAGSSVSGKTEGLSKTVIDDEKTTRILVSDLDRSEIDQHQLPWTERPKLKESAKQAATGVLHSARSVQLTAGVNLARREGNLIWDIASDSTGTRTPNVLSELSHLDLEMNELEVNLEVHFNQGLLNSWLLESRLRYGNVAHGQTQDSDYLGDNRTEEFSRSLSTNTGDYAADYSFALGYHVPLGLGLNIKGWFGYGKHEQFIRIEDAVQVLETANMTPSLGPLEGLNTTYQATWEGAWLGLEASVQMGAWQLSWRGEHHNVNYYAEANWNLRDSFEHPRSFEHIAEGQGNVIDLGVSYWLTLKRQAKISLDLVVRTQWWQASNGVDRVFFNTGSVVTTRFNEVDWESDSLRIGVHYIR